MPEISDWVGEIGEAATRLAALGALEGAAGNISLFVPADAAVRDAEFARRYPPAGAYALPEGLDLPPGLLVITGTSRRLRDIATRPEAVLCAIAVEKDGSTVLCRHPAHGVKPTSEIDSHLGVHAAVLDGGSRVHAVIHAQPPKLTWLSHIPAYRDPLRLNRQLLRWQPETLVMLPQGIGLLPYDVPGTPAQGAATAGAMRHHQLVVWAKHGVVARSERGPLAAADLIDYVEAAATYEVTDLLAGRRADGLTLAELRGIAARFGVSSDLLSRLPDELLR
jgi:rhamnulose-1-phosphate aldolase